MKKRRKGHLQVSNQSGLRTIVQQEVTAFRGPLPPPEILADFEKTVPGAARLIIENFDQQSKHRRTIESSTISTKNKATLRGQWIGAGVALAIAGMGFYLALIGRDAAAITAISAPIVGIISVFVYGRTIEYIERRGKRTPPTPQE